MSNSDNHAASLFALSLPASPGTTVTVYDGCDEAIARGDNGYPDTLELPRGLYTVRLEANSQVVEQIVRLTQAVDLRDFRVPRRSAAPLEGSSLSHDYYRQAAREWSLRHTRAALPATAGEQSSLFVFVRASNREAAQRSGDGMVGDGLTLLDADGRRVSEFPLDEVKRDQHNGWMAFSLSAPAGLFRLVATGDQRRELAIHLFPGFQTQVFILDNGQALLEEMRIFLAPPGAGFDATSAPAQAADAAMEAILNNSTPSPAYECALPANYTEHNPLCGLMRAYAMARRLQAAPGGMPRDEGELAMLDEQLRQLETLIPRSPDLAALRLLRNGAGGHLAPPAPFSAPPMFRLGLKAVLEASITDSNLIDEDSLVDRVTTRLLADSLWSIWSALPEQRVEPDALPSAPQARRLTQFLPVVFGILDLAGGRRGRGVMGAATQAPNQAASTDLTWLQAAVLAILQQHLSSHGDRFNPGGDFSLVQIARQTKTTPRAVKRELEYLLRLGTRELTRLLASHPDLRELATSDALKTALRALLASVATSSVSLIPVAGRWLEDHISNLIQADRRKDDIY